jgi:hypothetical protein
MTYLEDFCHFCHSPPKEVEKSSNVVGDTESGVEGHRDTKKEREIKFQYPLEGSDKSDRSSPAPPPLLNAVVSEHDASCPAVPVCMECERTGGVAYLELEGGDLLCGQCYAATLRELAARMERVEKQTEKRAEKARGKLEP